MLRIEYDDDAMDIISKVNDELKEHGITFEFADDEQEHDGFELYELKKVN